MTSKVTLAGAGLALDNLGAVAGIIILSGFNQPVVLLVISASTGGVIMFLYSFLLIVLNRGALPGAIQPPSWRVATLVWSTLFFGSLATLTIFQQLSRLI